MPIRRVTIELDDTVDQSSPTTVPETLTPSKSERVKDNTPSGLPNYDTEEDTVEQRITHRNKETGHTFADLIIELRDDHRVILTVLMFVPFIVFVRKIDSMASLKYPVATGIILNLTWFGGSWIVGLLSRIFNKK